MIDFSQLFFDDTDQNRTKSRQHKSSKQVAVPEAPVIYPAVPDIGSLLAGGDNLAQIGEDNSLLDLHSSQWFTDRQKSEIPRIYQIDRKRPANPIVQVDQRGDKRPLDQNDIHYQIFNKSLLHQSGSVPVESSRSRPTPTEAPWQRPTYDLLDDIGVDADRGPTDKGTDHLNIPVVEYKTPSKRRDKRQFLAPYQTPGSGGQWGQVGRRGSLDGMNGTRHRTPRDNIDTPAPLIIPVAGGMKLRSVMEIPEKFRKLFSFPYFNIVQSRVFDDVLYTDKPLVLCSPTGSGKTAVFEIAMIRLLMTENVNKNFKIVYMAPIKALCSERYLDWKDKLEPFGIRCMELTGDTDLDDFYVLQDVNVILTTPEKWDSMTRKWRDNQSVMQAICLFFIDEIHVLNDPTRGATVEAVVTRMKTIQAARSRSNSDGAFKHLRFIAVSATITNIEDVAEWLGNSASPAIYYKMDDSVRPVRLRKVILGYYFADNKRSEFQFDMTLSYKLAGVINTYAEDKPTLVFCSTRKGTQQAADILSRDVKGLYVRNSEHRQQLASCSYQLKDSKLRDLVCKGIAYHHAGLDLQDRKRVEESFLRGLLPVLVATSTLAMGVNLPAHLVIVKSTMYYNLGVHQEYSDIQILQMIGRAGRPQFDTSATAVIMTKNQTKMQYENLVNGTQLIESTLHKNLIEHLNAEIVLHTINDISVAVEWLKYTFLYIRVMKNPRHYGMPMGLTRDSIEKRLQDLCVKNLNQLHSLGLIRMDEETLEVKPTETGRLMARYCIAFKTTELLLDIKGTESISDLLSTVCKCHEFADIQLRINEKKTLNTLNRDKNRLTIRYPLTGKIKTTDMKVNCLIQATFGSLLIQDFALQQDTSRIFRAGIRVSRCLGEFLSQKNDYGSLLSALQLSKCFKARLWEDSKYVSKQLEGIGPTLSTALVNAGLTTFEKIEQTNPREIELIVNRHPPFGNQVRDSVAALPRYELMIEQVTRYSIDSAEIIITVQLSNRDVLKDRPATYHTCTLLVGDSDNVLVYKQRIMDSQLLKDNSWSKKLDVRRGNNGPDLRIHYISQDRVGLDVECTYTPNYLGGKIITNSTSISPKSITSAMPAKHTEYQPCNHACHDKQACAHECCKIGVSSRRRPKSTPKPNSTRPVMSHMNDMRNRLTSLPQTPGLKRPNLQFSSDPPTNNVDLSHYAYTPRTMPGVDVSRYQSPDTPRTMPGVDVSRYPSPVNAVDQSSIPNKPTTGVNSGWDQLELYQRHREQSLAAVEADPQFTSDVDCLPDLDSGLPVYQPRSATSISHMASLQQQPRPTNSTSHMANLQQQPRPANSTSHMANLQQQPRPANSTSHMANIQQQPRPATNTSHMASLQQQQLMDESDFPDNYGADIAQETDYGIMYVNSQDRSTMPATWEERMEGDMNTSKQRSNKVPNQKRMYPTQKQFHETVEQRLGTGGTKRLAAKESIYKLERMPRQYDTELRDIYAGYDDDGCNDMYNDSNTRRTEGYGNYNTFRDNNPGRTEGYGNNNAFSETHAMNEGYGKNQTFNQGYGNNDTFHENSSRRIEGYGNNDKYSESLPGMNESYNNNTSNNDVTMDVNDATIELYDSDGHDGKDEGKDSKWTSFFSSQSSTGSDYLSEQYPVRHDGELVQMATHMSRMPLQAKMTNNGDIETSKELSVNAGNGVSIGNSFLQNKQNKVRGNFGGNPQNVQKTALSYKRNTNNTIFGKKLSNAGILKKNDLEMNDDFHREDHASENSHKYGQVLAWVSSSQSKSTGGRSESDWEEWPDEADVLNGIDEHCLTMGVHVAADGHGGAGCNEMMSSEKYTATPAQSVAVATEPRKIPGVKGSHKPMTFTSFFGSSKTMFSDTSDNLTNIFEGILNK